MSKRRWNFIILAAILLLLTACSSGGQVMDGEDMVRSYTQISQDEAKQMMEQDGTQIIVDVRTQEEYDSGHIPGAICIPNESIGTEQPKELPDLDQVILIYCHSGNRSKQAAQKLFDKILTCTVVLKLVSFRAHIQSRRCLQYVNIESSSIPQKNALG